MGFSDISMACTGDKMTGIGFTLEPHPGIAAVPPVRVTGGIQRHLNTLFVHFQLDGRVEEVRIPPPSKIPVRRDRLWEETCFEFFIGPKGSESYWEFNASPSGDWNAYRFSSYRESMREEEAIRSLPTRIERGVDILLFSMECDLSLLHPAVEGIEAGISAVIKPDAGEAFYFALTHPGIRPDFHRRDGFLIEL